MKVLYAIQGTGNGHVSRAKDIIPILQNKCDLDVLISGHQSEITLPFPIKYQLKGISFVFGKKGGIDLFKTFLKHNSRRFLKEVRKLPVNNYDLVINDFEPVSAWASKYQKVPCVALSHQCAVMAANAPKPSLEDPVGKLILRRYAPANRHYGFHFEPYAPNIYPPVIRQQIRQLNPTNEGHYTVYLPAYKDSRLIQVLSEVKAVTWQVFSKKTSKQYRKGNVQVYPVSADLFSQSFAGCNGILCGAGFETPAEALYLGKKMFVIPMKGQYEQQCNAAALKKMGVRVSRGFNVTTVKPITEWVQEAQPIQVNYPDLTETIIDQLLAAHA